MSSYIAFPLLKIIAKLAAADTNGTAVALRERSAANVSFQCHQPSHPLHKIVNSAVSLVRPARHFSG